jgi:hypothetical protein
LAEKTPAQKLFIKEGYRIYAPHAPQDLAVLLGPLPAGARLVDHPEEPVDVILLFADTRAVLEADLPLLTDRLTPAGFLWVAYHKGTSQVKTDINRDSIHRYAPSVGLDTVFQIAIDADWSALRLKKIEET